MAHVEFCPCGEAIVREWVSGNTSPFFPQTYLSLVVRKREFVISLELLYTEEPTHIFLMPDVLGSM